MTLDAAINIEKSDIKYNKSIGCDTSYEEQLAEWLEELKIYKSLAPRELISEKQRNDRAIEHNKGFDYGFNTGYNKAVDDFAIKLKSRLTDAIYQKDVDGMENLIDEISKQLKEGA